MAAARGGHVACAKVLLDHGAKSGSSVDLSGLDIEQDAEDSIEKTLNRAEGVAALLHTRLESGVLARAIAEVLRHLACGAQDGMMLSVEEERGSDCDAELMRERCQRIERLLEKVATQNPDLNPNPQLLVLQAQSVPGIGPIEEHFRRETLFKSKIIPIESFGNEFSALVKAARETNQVRSAELNELLDRFDGTPDERHVHGDGKRVPEEVSSEVMEEMLDIVELDKPIDLPPSLTWRVRASSAGRACRREVTSSNMNERNVLNPNPYWRLDLNIITSLNPLKKPPGHCRRRPPYRRKALQGWVS